MDKKELRKEMRRIRGSLSAARILIYSNAIIDRLRKEPVYQNADTILSYMSFSSEVDTKFLHDLAWQDGKRVAVPKCRDKEEMDFYYITSKNEVALGMYGIMEPTTTEIVNPEDSGNYLLLLPGVAFDEQRNRIGYGGGYYDRYLSKHSKLPRIMLAYELQKTNEIIADETDQRADMIITEITKY